MTLNRRPLIAGNWKMNGLGDAGVNIAVEVVKHMQGKACAFDLLLCPPFTMLARIAAIVGPSPVLLGAQDCHTRQSGAHTGDISADMLVDSGCDFVIVGHSERRSNHAEDDAIVKAKAEAAHVSGLTAIICLGETRAERDAGQTLQVNKRQLAGSVPDGANASNTVIAYEPVWAIGSGLTPGTDAVQEVHGFIRSELASRFTDDMANAVRLLYGGSMNPGNAAQLLSLDDVDGGLIGGASLNGDDFYAIAKSCP